MKKYLKNISFLIILSFLSCNQCEEVVPAPCGVVLEGSPLVDLIVLLDTSSSMSGVAQSVSDAASDAIGNSQELCDTDLRVDYFGIGGTFPGTVFIESQIFYLNTLHGTSLTLFSTQSPSGHLNEVGADAMSDLSIHYDWRQNACRSILYITDEPVNGGTTSAIQDENIAVDNAIMIANQNKVALFTHAIGNNFLSQERRDNFDRLCMETGGMNFTTSVNVTTDTYLQLLPDVICNACNACTLNGFVN